MAVYNSLNADHALFKQWRQHLHQNPELGLHEHKTSAFVQQRLDEMGIEYHTGFAGTGVIGVIKNGTSERSIGLRGDMDALPITEDTNLPYQSQNDGIMHACGHDGHTTILLATAKYLSETKNFDGTVYLYFQPAEENGVGGGRIMLNDGAFDRFKPDAMYGLHNRPGLPTGHVGYRSGAMTANSDQFQIDITGTGCHAAEAYKGADPVVTSAHLILALQSIISRNVDPLHSAVLSSCVLQTGTATNIVPETALIKGTVRTQSKDVQNLIEKRMQEMCQGLGHTFNSEIKLTYKRGYPVTMNTEQETEWVRQAATDVVGEDRVAPTDCIMAGEDFAFFLEQVPGCYFLLGNGDGSEVHTPTYNFNDDIIPIGASIFSRLVEQQMPQ